MFFINFCLGLIVAISADVELNPSLYCVYYQCANV